MSNQPHSNWLDQLRKGHRPVFIFVFTKLKKFGPFFFAPFGGKFCRFGLISTQNLPVFVHFSAPQAKKIQFSNQEWNVLQFSSHFRKFLLNFFYVSLKKSLKLFFRNFFSFKLKNTDQVQDLRCGDTVKADQLSLYAPRVIPSDNMRWDSFFGTAGKYRWTVFLFLGKT